MLANAFINVSHSVLRTAVGAFGTVIFAGACLMGAAAPASAAPAATGEARVAYVTVSDLNLAVPADQARLNMRINRAARLVCWNGSNDVRSRSNEARCVSTAKADAKGQANVTIASRD